MMRIRLLSLVLALMLVFPVAAFAELNLADYSLEDLIALKTQIQAEITIRTADDRLVRVPQGSYIIGVDIPAGTYTITTAGELAMVTLYTSDDRFVTMHSMYRGESIGKIELQTGQKIEIIGGDVVFSTYKGLGF